MSKNIVVIRLGAFLALGVACVSVALAHQEPGDVTQEVEKIAAMSPDELRAYERRLVHELANLELVPPWITTNPPPRYAKARQNFGMNGGLFSYGGDSVSIVDFMIKRNEYIHSKLGF